MTPADLHPPQVIPPPAPAASGVSLTLRNLTKTFNANVHALAGISLDIPAGQFLSLIGPSGCGKSTLLRIIASLDHPTSGTIQIHTQSNARAKTAFVFQAAHTLPSRHLLNT